MVTFAWTNEPDAITARPAPLLPVVILEFDKPYLEFPTSVHFLCTRIEKKHRGITAK